MDTSTYQHNLENTRTIENLKNGDLPKGLNFKLHTPLFPGIALMTLRMIIMEKVQYADFDKKKSNCK